MLAEAHSRNIFSCTPLLFTLILLSIFLRNNFSKFDNFSEKFFIFCIVFSIQIILFVLKKFSIKIFWLHILLLWSSIIFIDIMFNFNQI